MFYLDMPEDMPVIYLNLDFPNLYGLLEKRERVGIEKAMHGTVMSTIALGSWIGIFNAVAAEIGSASSPDEVEDDDVALPLGWRGGAVVRLLRRLDHFDTPGRSARASGRVAHQRRREHSARDHRGRTAGGQEW